ncbi:metalloendopeptidase [Clostridium polyendosporum]|uniref:Metalloendopeptidase n=1 Tax=Clostridium polyendosporum TaxID=69208 RepID=A0A919RXE8_9CLOT|nr:M23 family metallopeptidase [Clostridium polyendosporum]GIM27544.1 metalloendopeptidase [Clostridium polyendosporum]
MIKKKVFSLLLCFALFSGNYVQANAISKESLQNQINSNNEKIDDLKDKQQQISKEKENQKDELDKIQEQLDQKSNVVKDSQSKIDNYQTQINSLQSKITQVQDQINKVTNQIRLTEDEIKEKQQEEKEKKELLGRRLRTAYKNNIGEQFISVILESNDITDFITKVANIAKIVEKDNELINEVQKIQDELNNKQKQLNEQKKSLDTQKQQVVDEQNKLKVTTKQLLEERDKHKIQIAELEALESKKTVIIGGLNAKEKELKEQIGDLGSYNDDLQNQINDMFKQINSSNNSNSNSNSSSKSNDGGQTVVSESGFIRPSAGAVTCPFGPRIHPVTKKSGFHTGVDLGAPYGSSIKAAKSGVVVRAEFNTAYGNMIIIDHGNGYQTLYAHASQNVASVGQQVTQGQTVAYVGSTGWSTGPHLHFEVRINGNPVNPMNYI